MPTLMLKPGWTGGRFQRTVTIGKRRPKLLRFENNSPVEVSDDEYLALGDDIGVALFDVEVDDKGRARFVEPAGQLEPAGDANP